MKNSFVLQLATVAIFLTQCHAGLFDWSLFNTEKACEDHDCINGACAETAHGYECVCYPGFKGAKCDYECPAPEPVGLPVECEPINAVIVHMSTASDGCPLYELQCKNGGRPQLAIACKSANPCVHGTCIEYDGDSDTECICEVGWVGANCDTACEIDTSNTDLPSCDVHSMRLVIQPTGGCPLTETVCEHQLRKRATGDSNACPCMPCMNGGSCADGGICDCTPLFNGTFCDIAVVTPCTSSPCQNGGTCTVDGAGYICVCPSCVVGTNCQMDKSLCMCPPAARRVEGSCSAATATV